MKHDISSKFYSDIYRSLRTDYIPQEITEMLATANITEDEESVTVTYTNGITDRFIKVVTLLHENDYDNSITQRRTK